MLKIVRKLFMSILAMLLVIGPITISNNEVNAEDAETQEVKVTVHWDDDDNAKNYRPETFTVNLYTKEKLKVIAKYAVSIYGIEQDIDENGNIMGLTFGPAIGNDYTNSHRSHTPTGNTSNGNQHRCVHEDDWNTIIKWNNVDPYVYEQCIETNCTHSVDIYHAGETIINPRYVDEQIVLHGDGPSTLYYELYQPNDSTYHNAENLRWHPNNNMPYSTSQKGTSYNGWGASRIRAMMNGADGLTDIGDGTANKPGGTDVYASKASSDLHKSASIYTSTNNLLACFPDELQEAIGKRKTLYDSVYNAKNEANLKATYDKLWLLSPPEINHLPQFQDVYDNNPNMEQCYHPLEAGTVGVYQKFIQNNKSIVTYNTTGDSYYSAYSVTPKAITHNQVMSAKLSWHLRSVAESDKNSHVNVNNFSVSYGDASVAVGVSPCFALSRNNSSMAKAKNLIYDIKDSLSSLFKPTVVNAEGKNSKYSLTLPTADGDVDYIFHIPSNEEVTRVTAQEPNTHYEQELDLDLNDMDNLRVNMRSTGPKVQGSTAKLKKYLVVKNDAEIPEAEFNFTISAGAAIGAADNHTTVYAGKDSDKVKVNGTAKTGKVTFTAGESATAGPLTDVATAEQKYVMKDIVLDFSQVSFDEPGVYRYILTEQENTSPAINNDIEPTRVIDVHVMWNDEETDLVVDGYVGYIASTVLGAPKLMPEESLDTFIDSSIFSEDTTDRVRDTRHDNQVGIDRIINEYDDDYVIYDDLDFYKYITDKFNELYDSLNVFRTYYYQPNSSNVDYSHALNAKITSGDNEIYTSNVTKVHKISSDRIFIEFEFDNGTLFFFGADSDYSDSNQYIGVAAYPYQEEFIHDVKHLEIITKIDGSGKPAGSYVNAQEPIGVEAGEKSDKYVNNLDSANLSLTKEVKGNQGSKDQYFEFTVAITNAGKNTVMTLDMSEAENGITHENSATSFSKAAMDEANLKDDDKTDVLYTQADYDAYVTENGEEPEWSVNDVKKPAKTGQQIIATEDGSVTFKLYLHHNQTANLKGLPKGTTYTITETTAAGYNTTSENETGEIDTTDIAAKFINERSGVVPTGILVSASGGLALLALCIFGFILSFRRKLREED